jgi:hypothetical protein
MKKYKFFINLQSWYKTSMYTKQKLEYTWEIETNSSYTY